MAARPTPSPLVAPDPLVLQLAGILARIAAKRQREAQQPPPR